VVIELPPDETSEDDDSSSREDDSLESLVRSDSSEMEANEKISRATRDAPPASGYTEPAPSRPLIWRSDTHFAQPPQYQHPQREQSHTAMSDQATYPPAAPQPGGILLQDLQNALRVLEQFGGRHQILAQGDQTGQYPQHQTEQRIRHTSAGSTQSQPPTQPELQNAFRVLEQFSSMEGRPLQYHETRQTSHPPLPSQSTTHCARRDSSTRPKQGEWVQQGGLQPTPPPHDPRFVYTPQGARVYGMPMQDVRYTYSAEQPPQPPSQLPYILPPPPAGYVWKADPVTGRPTAVEKPPSPEPVESAPAFWQRTPKNLRRKITDIAEVVLRDAGIESPDDDDDDESDTEPGAKRKRRKSKKARSPLPMPSDDDDEPDTESDAN
jgi:hypothetical protein